MWYTACNEIARFTQGALIEESTKDTTCVQNNGRNIKLWKFIVTTIDPTTSLYTRTMYNDACNQVKHVWMAWISTYPGSVMLGPKKCRYIMSWLSGVRKVDTDIVRDFVAWMLDTPNISVISIQGELYIKNDT